MTKHPQTTWQPLSNETKPLTFLFLFSGFSVVFAGDLQDGLDAAVRGDYKTAYKLWLPLAEQGDAEAQYNLGVMYEHSLGVPQDYKTAVKWYRLSAEQGLAIAQSRLGFLHLLGIRGVQQDYKRSSQMVSSCRRTG